MNFFLVYNHNYLVFMQENGAFLSTLACEISEGGALLKSLPMLKSHLGCACSCICVCCTSMLSTTMRARCKTKENLEKYASPNGGNLAKDLLLQIHIM